MAKLFANSGDPDQMPYFVASDLGMHCLPITLFGVFRLKWIKVARQIFKKTVYKDIQLGKYLQ